MTPITPKSAATMCRWCGQPIEVSNARGRKPVYCSRSCRQRAYEHRVALSQRQIEARGSVADDLFALRCAAEDLAIAVEEGATTSELRQLSADLVGLARQAELRCARKPQQR